MGTRDTITVTQVWQKIASGTVTVEIAKVGSGSLLFNQIASDTDAKNILPILNEQFAQNETVDTYIRATGDGWKVWIDGVL